MRLIDCRDMPCPGPLKALRKLVEECPGEPVRLLVRSDTARHGIESEAREVGLSVVAQHLEEGYALELRPLDGAADAPGADAAERCIVLVTSDQLGQGDEGLGRLLMKNFLGTLLELETLPWRMIFLNSGVRLTTRDSDVTEPLGRFVEKGVEILSCGTCLDYYNLKNRLAVGRVGTMRETVESLSMAGRIIRP
ncbi:MAG: sulfurtransferase-like selenium metabolism protein YedF [Deltaproteobacteria bacterium]|nr:MAG: sulfurtransferase-like selenium metabolism protein YedF [Deltaproteobacteria bacterium]